MLQLFLQLTLASQQTLYLFDSGIARAFHQLTDLLQGTIILHQPILGGLASERFDASHTCCHTTFATNDKLTNIAGTINMGSATKFHGETIAAHTQNAHSVTIFFTKQHGSAHGSCGIHISNFCAYLGVIANLLIDDLFHRLDLCLGHRFTVGEVEA